MEQILIIELASIPQLNQIPQTGTFLLVTQHLFPIRESVFLGVQGISSYHYLISIEHFMLQCIRQIHLL